MKRKKGAGLYKVLRSHMNLFVFLIVSTLVILSMIQLSYVIRPGKTTHWTIDPDDTQGEITQSNIPSTQLDISPQILLGGQDQIALTESPVQLQDFFLSGEFHDTVLDNGRLQLNESGGEYVESGEWISPVFYIDDPDLKGLWNHLESVSNWEDFRSNFAGSNHGFEDENMTGWMQWQLNSARDNTYSHTGNWSYKLSSTTHTSGALFSNISGDRPIEEQYNLIPVTENDVVHLTYWVKTDIIFGKLFPKLMFIKELNGNFFGTDIGELAIDNYVFKTSKSSDFVRVQVEFRLKDVVPIDQYNYYAYPWIKLEDVNVDAPQSVFWIDDVQLFKDSKITLQARTSQEEDCSGMSAWQERPRRLLFNNYVTVPAPISSCIQFKINFNRINETASPILDDISLTYSDAFEFSMPEEDTTQAIFNRPNPPISQLHVTNGEIMTENEENVRFSGTMVTIKTMNYTLTKYGVEGPEKLGEYVCNFSEKYGLNMIKGFGQWWSFTEEEVVSALDYYAPMVEKCKEKGIYFYILLTPQKYANTMLGNDLCNAGYCGAWEFMDDSIIDVYKDYIDIVFNFEYGGIPIKDDPAFVFTYLMNEKTLLRAWRFNKIDGVYEYDKSENKEVSEYWVERLRMLFENWTLEHYPTFEDLITAWNYSVEGPFVEADGECNALTYGTDTCNIIMLTYSYHDQEGYEKRVEDLVQFFVEREEFVYSELSNHIQNNISSNILISGGKPLFGMMPTMMVSSEVLDNQDIHDYLSVSKSFWSDTEDYITISNEPIIPRYNYELVGAGLKKAMMNGRPKIVGETAYTGFSEHVAENILLSLLGGTSGLDLYVLYALNHLNINQEPLMRMYQLQKNIPVLVMEPTASRLFRRDLDRSEKSDMILKRTTALNYSMQKPFYQDSWIDPANTFFYEIGYETFNGSADVLPPLQQDIEPPFITDDFEYDVENRKVRIKTDGTEGVVGNYDGDSENLDFLHVEFNQIQGLPTFGVFVTAIDGETLSDASELLLTLVSKADNSNHLWDTYHRKAVYNNLSIQNHPYGDLPIWMAAVDADISLQIDKPITIYPLNEYGQQKGFYFYSEPANGEVNFTVDSQYMTPWYQIRVEDNCLDECAFENKTQCSNETHYYLCGDYDEDECFDWGGLDDCGVTECNASIHLSGSCNDHCSVDIDECIDCIPSYPGDCECIDGWGDEDGNETNGCEHEIIVPDSSPLFSKSSSGSPIFSKVSSSGSSSSGSGSGIQASCEINDLREISSSIVSSRKIRSWAVTDAGKTYDWIIDDRDIIIEKISLIPETGLPDVKIILSVLMENPTDIKIKNHEAYQFFDIGSDCIDDQSLTQLRIIFSVEEDWIVDNDLEKDDIRLMRFENDVWRAFPAKELTNNPLIGAAVYSPDSNPECSSFSGCILSFIEHLDRFFSFGTVGKTVETGRIFYEATSSKFSYFLIVGIRDDDLQDENNDTDTGIDDTADMLNQLDASNETSNIMINDSDSEKEVVVETPFYFNFSYKNVLILSVFTVFMMIVTLKVILDEKGKKQKINKQHISQLELHLKRLTAKGYSTKVIQDALLKKNWPKKLIDKTLNDLDKAAEKHDEANQ